MNNLEQHYYEIIKEGPYKGKRLYFEHLYGAEFVFPVESYYVFKNALKNNYKIFYVNCTFNHSIKIPEWDYQFLTSVVESHKIYKEHMFSNEVLNLKNLQHLDIKKLYNISVNSDKVGTLIIHPKIESKYYYFDFIIFIKNDFDLNVLLKINFDLIKIKSLTEINNDNLMIDKIYKMYDFTNFLFKDNIVLPEDLEKTRINRDNEVLIPELTEWIKLLKLSNKYLTNSKTPFTPYDDEIKKLKHIINIKRDRLTNKNLYKKLVMSKMCTQFWTFHEVILSDSVFYTNFLQLTGGVSPSFDNGELTIDYNGLYPYSWCDLICDDEHKLFSRWEPIYQWITK